MASFLKPKFTIPLVTKNAEGLFVVGKTLMKQIHPQEFSGYVVSAKRLKTVTVAVSRLVPHPLYKKVQSIVKKYHVHDENNLCKEGAYVRFVPVEPISKQKSFLATDIIREPDLSKPMVREAFPIKPGKGKKK